MLHHTNLSFKEEMQTRGDFATKFIILHHTEEKTKHTIEEVHEWFIKKKKGNAGCPYHFFIDKKGEIYEGRPLWAVGAYTRGYNQVSVGIGFEGDFNKEIMKEEQEESAVMLLSLLSLAFNDAVIVRHCDFIKEANSPGKNFPYESPLISLHTLIQQVLLLMNPFSFLVS